MSFVKFAVCLIIGWACEDDIPTTTTGVTEVYPTDLPGPEQGCDLSGLWYNELGSEAYLKVAPDGLIKGEYRTSVEFNYGAAGEGPSYVAGTSTPDGRIFGFSVWWDGHNTTSATSWVGVCEICDGQPILKTSWVLQYVNEGCGERNKWEGENTFTRSEQKPGPRRAYNINNPRDFQEWYRTRERNWGV